MALFEMRVDIERPSKEVIAEFAKIPTAVLSDAMGNLSTMDSGVRALTSGADICGPAVTVLILAGDMLATLKGLAATAPGDVLVIDSQSRQDTALWGEITSREARWRGVCGLVADGPVRDIAEIRKLGFPVFARGTTPRVAGRSTLGEVNVPVSCGGVVVSPGDIVRGDEDGVVVVPLRRAAEVLERAKVVLVWEKEMRELAIAGKSQMEILNLDNFIAEKLKAFYESADSH